MELEYVNPLPVSEVAEWVRAFASTLLADPYEADFGGWVQRWRDRWDPERVHAVRDAGRIVATLATEARTMTVPGPDATATVCPVDALTGVSVAATHRRQGLLTRMITNSLRAAKDRGDALSVLVAAEWPIYGRFGYGPAVRTADYVYRPRARGATVTPSGRGRLRQVEPAEMVELAPAIFERARLRRAGQIDRAGTWWARTLNVGYDTLGKPRHWMVREGDDGPDGLLGWRVTRDFDLDGTLGAIDVDSLVAASDDAYRDLWAYLGSLDVVDEVQLHHYAVDEPARFLLADGRALRQTFAGDLAWLRVLDVPAALSARGWSGQDRLVLEVVDDHPGAPAGGRYAIDAGPDGAECRPTTATADLTLSARALGTVYLGGHSLAGIRPAGGVDEHTPGAVRRFDALLATPLAPWCQTGF